MIDYDMGSHLLSLRMSDYENDTLGLIDRDYAGAYPYGYPQEVRTNAGIETFEARISNQDNDKFEYTLGVFSRDSETFTHADLDRSFDITEVAPHLYSKEQYHLITRHLLMHVRLLLMMAVHLPLKV